jgi:hypothetical protein
MAGVELRSYLRRWIHTGVYITTKLFLGGVEGGRDLAEGRVADDHQVDVTLGRFLPGSHRAVYESDPSFGGEIGQRPTKHVSDTARLDHQAPELLVDRASAVGLVVPLPALHLTDDDSQIGQAGQLAAEVGAVLVNKHGELPYKDPLVWVGEHPPECLGA